MSRVNRGYIDQWYDLGIDLDSKTMDLSAIGDGHKEDDDDLTHRLGIHIIKSLHILDRVKPEQPLTIFLNCRGGEVTAGISIYDAIRLCKSQVHIQVTGCAWSMGAWILQAGDKRLMRQNSTIMIHEGSPDAVPYKALRGTYEFSLRQDKLLTDIILDRIRQKHPGYSASKYYKLLQTDSYITATEAVELGLADEII